MTYNGSELHLENLRKAREKANNIKTKKNCPVCGILLWPAGYSKHVPLCIELHDCPVCGKRVKHKNNVTCSHSCSNTYFRTGKDHPNFNDESTYRKICFKFHKKKCVCCEEKLIVAVHHLDHNSKNNDPINLIPLCPTHHQYWHSRHRYIVEPIIRKYISEWIKNRV